MKIRDRTASASSRELDLSAHGRRRNPWASACRTELLALRPPLSTCGTRRNARSGAPPQREQSSASHGQRARLPLHAVVALCATRDICRRELLPVDVFMAVSRTAVGAALKSTLINLVSRFGGLWQSMQAVARCAPSSGKFRLRVIEARDFLPRFGGVAGLASGRDPSARTCSIRSLNWPLCGSAWQLVQFRFCQ